MLQLQYIRDHQEAIIEALDKRTIDAKPMLDRVLELDSNRRKTQTELDESSARMNQLSKEIGGLYKSGKAAEAEALKEETASLKQQIKELTDQLNDFVDSLNNELYQIPNVPHQSVVKGNSEDDNEIVLNEGELPTLGSNALPHWELAKKYDLIDFELGVKIAGAGFPVYKGKGARLQRALISYFLDKNTEAGYTEVQPPLVVNEASGYGTGQLPDKEGQMYHIGIDDLYLIPTAEVPVTNIFRDSIVSEKELPKRVE
jgi:seryl-tRNA synthetase